MTSLNDTQQSLLDLAVSRALLRKRKPLGRTDLEGDGREINLRRFLHRIKFDNSGCWIWNGYKRDDGSGCIYGITSISPGRQVLAHRLSYFLFNGPLDECLVIDHLCRVCLCCNPTHLQQVASGVNILRGNGRAGLNSIKTHCIHGHEFTEKNTRIQIREDGTERACRECERIRSRLYNPKRKLKKLEQHQGVSV